MRSFGVIARAGLVVLVWAGGFVESGGAAEGMPPASVILGTVEKGQVRDSRIFVGTLEAERAGVVDAQIAGYLEELLVEEGDRVEHDQVIARLRTEALDLRLAVAKAEVELRRQELLELESGSRAEEIEEARARLAEVDARLATARWKLETTRALRQQDRLTEEELRDATFAVKAAEASRAAEAAALALLVAGPRVEKIAQAQARVQAQDAEIARLEEERTRHEVRAPYAGFVATQHAEVGRWLNLGEPIVDLVALDQLDVVVPVPEDFIGALQLGAKVTVQVEALSDPAVEGTIHRILPRADVRARTIALKIRVANHYVDGVPALRAGMFARVALAVGQVHEALLVPKDALVLGGPQPVVYVVDPASSTAKPVAVELGVAVDGRMEVIGPIQAGQKIVVQGNERLQPGARVVETR